MRTVIQSKWVLLLWLGVAFFCAAFTTEKSGVGAAPFDTAFVRRAASGSAMQQQLGQMAQEKGQSADVKSLGAAIAKDHAKLNSDLMALAKSLSITVPDTLTRRDQRHVQHLSSMSGATFDRLYLRLMADAHGDEAAEYEAAAAKATIPSLKEFATKQVAMLKAHQTAAQTLRNKLRSSK